MFTDEFKLIDNKEFVKETIIYIDKNCLTKNVTTLILLKLIAGVVQW